MKPRTAVGPQHAREVEQLRVQQAHIVAETDEQDMLMRRRASLETYGANIRHTSEIHPIEGPVRGEWIVPPAAD